MLVSLRTLFIVTSIAFLSLAGAAFADTSNDETPAQEDLRRCMFARDIGDFEVIDRHHVVLIDRWQRTFLLGEVRGVCWGLSHAFRIGIATRWSNVCQGSSVTLYADGDRCRVVRLVSVGSMEAALALVAERSEEEEPDATSDDE